YVFMSILFPGSCPCGGLAAVDRDDGAGDERGLVGGEPGDERGHLVEGAAAPEWNGCGDPRADLLRELLEPVACDRAGGDRLSADAAPCVVERRRPGQADDGVLAGDVAGHAPDAP